MFRKVVANSNIFLNNFLPSKYDGSSASSLFFMQQVIAQRWLALVIYLELPIDFWCVTTSYVSRTRKLVKTFIAGRK